MTESIDYLIVGSGLTGAVLARLLHETGREVLVLDRRQHLGGNVHDELHQSGIRFHTYGPHLFRTNSQGIWSFVNQYADFYPYQHQVSTFIDEQFEAWPITQDYLERTVGQHWTPGFTGKPTNFEEASLKIMPSVVYEKFVRDYTIKQWGVAPTSLAPELAKRFDVRTANDRRFSRQKYQGLPVGGYAALMRSLLTGIEVRTGVDFLQCRDRFHVRRNLIFTGPIDEYFGFDFGKLQYRGQRRASRFLADVEREQPDTVVNYPALDDGDFVRQIEWKQMMSPSEQKQLTGTLLTTETPFSPASADEFEYPFPDKSNAELYSKYRRRADAEEQLLMCGRLGEYRYYDMDHAIGRAFVLAKRVLKIESQHLDNAAIDAIPDSMK